MMAQPSGDGSVWEEAIENTRHLLEESKKQIELLRKQAQVQKGRREASAVTSPNFTPATATERLPKASSTVLPKSSSRAKTVRKWGSKEGEETREFGGTGSSGLVSLLTASEPLLNGSEAQWPTDASSNAWALGGSDDGAAAQPSHRSALFKNTREKSRQVPPPSARKAGSRRTPAGQASSSPAGGVSPGQMPRFKKGAASPGKSQSHGQRAGGAPQSSTSMGRSSSTSRPASHGSYMDATRASDGHRRGKVHGGVLKKGSGIGGGPLSESWADCLRSENSQAAGLRSENSQDDREFGRDHSQAAGLRSENSQDDREFGRDRSSSGVLVPPPAVPVNIGGASSNSHSGEEPCPAYGTSPGFGQGHSIASEASGVSASMRAGISVVDPGVCSVVSGGTSLSISASMRAGISVVDPGVCSVASGGGVGGSGYIGGGAGSVSAVSSSSGQFPAGAQGNMYGFGSASFGGSSTRIWPQTGETSGTASSMSSTHEIGGLSAAVVMPRPVQRAVVPTTYADTHDEPLLSSVTQQIYSDQNDLNELAGFFENLSQKSDSAVGVKSTVSKGHTEDMLDQFQRAIQERQLNQLRLEELESKLSKLKQENADLVMQNFKLRTQGQSSGGARPRADSGDHLNGSRTATIPGVVNASNLVGMASTGATGSSWSVRAFSPRSTTPVPMLPSRANGASGSMVHGFDALPRSVSVSNYGYQPSTGHRVATVHSMAGSTRVGAGVMQGPIASASRSRSESPGPRAAWAAATYGARSPVTPLSSPRVQTARRVSASPFVSPLRQGTPTPDREYSRIPLQKPCLSGVSSGSMTAPAGLSITPLGSAVVACARPSPQRSFGASIVTSPSPDASLAASYLVPAADPRQQLSPARIVGNGSSQLLQQAGGQPM